MYTVSSAILSTFLTDWAVIAEKYSDRSSDIRTKWSEARTKAKARIILSIVQAIG